MHPGPWEGAYVFVEERHILSILCSQEKRDCVRRHLKKWRHDLDNLSPAGWLDRKDLERGCEILVHIIRIFLL